MNAGARASYDRAMPRVPFPTSYTACRDDFRESAEHAGAAATGTPITATGPDGLGLTIDVAVLGPPSPERALFVMAGVHGVEGFTGSPIMCHALSRWGERDLPHGVGIVFVHAVNPWGMAWLRRQNEPNVDLNRNWAAGTTQGTDDNPGYATLHDILCRSARRRRHRSRSWTRRRASSRSGARSGCGLPSRTVSRHTPTGSPSPETGPRSPRLRWRLSPHSTSPPHTTSSSSISTPGTERTAT